MTDGAAAPAAGPPDGPAEVARLKEIIRALMDRAERSTSMQGSDYGAFQAAIMLEDQVRRRTAELRAALGENESINRALRESEAKFRGLVSQSLVGIVLIEEGRIVYSNAKFDEIFGYRSEEIRAMQPADVAVESDRVLVEENVRKRMTGVIDHLEYSFRGRRKDNTVIDIECHSSVLHIGKRTLLVSLIIDVTTRKQAEAKILALQDELREQSTHDPLTGIYNRRYLDESLARELSLAARTRQPISVVMGDLDHFKAVNDQYGHLAGDEVLRCFGNLLRLHTRDTDICCRYGGEEFILVLPGVPQAIGVERAEQLRRLTEGSPVCYRDSLISVTASFGVATFPHHGTTADDLITAADRALYAAKSNGRNRVTACPAPPDTADVDDASLAAVSVEAVQT